MGKTNTEWHLANKMPRNPTEEQRLAWHIAHARNCQCRAIPPGIIALAARRGISLETGKTEG